MFDKMLTSFFGEERKCYSAQSKRIKEANNYWELKMRGLTVNAGARSGRVD